MKPSHIRSERGVALVTTIIVVTVLATIAVALLQSTGTDRLSSRTVANHFKARLLADAAAAEAVSALVSTSIDNPAAGFREFMVNSYVERTVNFGGSSTAPYLATHRLGTDFSSIQETRLLVSTGNYSDISQVPSNRLVDLNLNPSCSTPNPIGLADADGNPRPVPAAWIDVTRNPAQPANNDPSSAGYNPVIGRFAFWIDDESSKVDIGTAGNLTGTQILRAAGSHPNQVSPIPFLAPIPAPGASFSLENDPATFVRERDEAAANGLILTADTTRLLEGNAAGYLSANWDGLKSMLTAYSRGDERGPFGTRKINLNDFVALNTDLTSPRSRDAIASATVALGDFINGVMPQFGNRAYSGGVSDSDRRRYCIQLAANIRDYIDADSQPTAIMQGSLLWLQPPNPNQIGAGAPGSPPLAFGKEIVPSVTEYMAYYYNLNGNMRIDHTFEVLNIYSSSVNMASLQPVTLIVAERNEILPGLNSNAPNPSIPGEPGTFPLQITLPNTPLPAGQYSLYTTLLPGSPLRNEAQWVHPNPNYIYVTSNENQGGYSYGSNGLRMNEDTSNAEVNTEICLVNNFGYLDFHARVAQEGPLTFNSVNTQRLASQPFGNSPTAVGQNNTHRGFPLDSGDPRSNTEVFPSFSETGAVQSSIAWRRNNSNTPQAGTNLGSDTNTGSSGFIPSNSAVNTASRIPEPLLQTGAVALDRQVATIRNGPMRTIGELGLIYDPAIHTEGYDRTGGANTRRRGGFRTLSIGSSVGERSGPNRLAHTLTGNSSTTAGNPTISPMRAHRLLDIFTANSSERGKILVNSSLRDPRNLPLKSLFHNLQLQSNTTSNSTSDHAAPADSVLGASGENIDFNALLDSWELSERQNGPFLSTGQLADLDVFSNSELGVDLAPNAANTNALDRGREELLRNTFGLLTLKGSVYKIYAIGQTGSVNSQGLFVVGSTAYLQKTIELEREYPNANGLVSTTAADLQRNNRATGINVRTVSTQFD